jgi:hypothetical protein
MRKRQIIRLAAATAAVGTIGGLGTTAASAAAVPGGAVARPAVAATSWTPGSAVPGATTTDGPALAIFGTKLYAAWTGPNTDKVFYESFNGKWSASASVPQSSTVASPALAAFHGRLYAVWAGRLTNGLFYSSAS